MIPLNSALEGKDNFIEGYWLEKLYYLGFTVMSVGLNMSLIKRNTFGL